MAFEAFENKKLSRAYLLKELPKEILEQKKFECPCCEKEMIFINEYIKQKGIWRAHFAHTKNSACEGYTPEGESREHYSIKMILLEDLHNKKPVKIIVNGLTWAFSYEDILYIKEEKFEINNRRADIIIILKQPNFILGNGIAIEVMVSEKQSSIDSKAIDYAQELLSVAQTKDGEQIEIIKTYPKVLKDFLEKTFTQYKNEINYYEERIKLIRTPFIEKALKNNWTCLNCDQASQSKTKGFICCWKEKNKGLTKHPTERADFAPCNEYKELRQGRLPLIDSDFEEVKGCSQIQKNF
jgi:hypothetical protein